MRREPKFLAMAAAVAIIGVMVGMLAWGALHGDSAPLSRLLPVQEVAAGVVAPAAEQWVCPMHPEVVGQQPGNCPICGMTLVKLRNGKSVKHSDLIHADQAMQQRIGIRLHAAQPIDLGRPIHAFGTVVADESANVSVNPKAEGWVRRLAVQSVGQPVRKGQILFELYSPDLQQRQRDYLDLLTRRDALTAGGMEAGVRNSAMVRSIARERFRVRDRLLAADVPPDVIAELDRTRQVRDVIPVRAERDGIVTAVSARAGSYVNPTQPVLAYNDPSRVWVDVVLYPDQLGWLRDGDRVSIRPDMDRTAQLATRVNLAHVQADAQTRAVRLRLPLHNAGQKLKLGDLVSVDIAAGTRRALAVPKDALLRTGHGDFVVVAEGGDHFRHAKVETGVENDEFVELVAGLGEGEQVVVNGQFLLDSAASLEAARMRLAADDHVAIAPADGGNGQMGHAHHSH